MNTPFIFISCGQYTPEEKRLGTKIAQMVKDLTEANAFFAENVQDLNGLDTNILTALHDCAALIVVLHPRGTIGRPDGPPIVRASVWIEQEIAIATYIQRVEKRALPIIAFKHASVGLEGLRKLLHLNPIEFTDESEVLAVLGERLLSLAKSLKRDIWLELISTASRTQDGHAIRRIELKLVNDTNGRITDYNGELLIPAPLLKHFANTVYPHESGHSDPRCFQFDEKNSKGTVNPHTQVSMLAYDYCQTCGETHFANLLEVKIKVKMWINGQEYSVEQTPYELEHPVSKKAAQILSGEDSKEK